MVKLILQKFMAIMDAFILDRHLLTRQALPENWFQPLKKQRALKKYLIIMTPELPSALLIDGNYFKNLTDTRHTRKQL